MLILFFREVNRVSIQENWEYGEREHIYLSKLQKFFTDLDNANKKKESQIASHSNLMKQHFGFNIEVKTSSIKDAGRGVFVKDGVVPKFSITSMYPGQYYIVKLCFFYVEVK